MAAMCAHMAQKNGGRTGKPWRGSQMDYVGSVVLDPRIDGDTVCTSPRSKGGRIRLERLQTALGVYPKRGKHVWGKHTPNPKEVKR